MFLKSFEKTAALASKLGKHVSKHRRDYLMGAAAIGSLGTAVGANRAASKEQKK